MAFSLGIVGLPNVGKSTLFNALTSLKVEAANYPFCTIDKNVGMVTVPDERLAMLNRLLKPVECVPTTIEFVDIAGLVKNAHKGEGLGNTFLSHIREVAAMVHVVRCFVNDNIIHVTGAVDPLTDISVVATELYLADLQVVENRLEKVKKMLKSNEKSYIIEDVLLEKLKNRLGSGQSVASLQYSDEEKEFLNGYQLLALKPVLYIANVDEKAMTGAADNPWLPELEAAFGKDKVVKVCAQIESELGELSLTEQVTFLHDMGLHESGLVRLVRAGYGVLDLITFYTMANDKLRAWRLKKGRTAPQAAGLIHSDMEKGFIKAEVMRYEDLVKHQAAAAVREKGLLRIEGKDYCIQDGDVVKYNFNA